MSMNSIHPRKPLACLLMTFAVIALSLISSGCGPGGPAMATVTGTVSYAGEPIQDGEIRFIPTNTSLRAEGGKIVGGQYSLLATVGDNRVEIVAAKHDPKRDGNFDFVPAKYNTASKLTANVVEKVPNRFDFPLEK